MKFRWDDDDERRIAEDVAWLLVRKPGPHRLVLPRCRPQMRQLTARGWELYTTGGAVAVSRDGGISATAVVGSTPTAAPSSDGGASPIPHRGIAEGPSPAVTARAKRPLSELLDEIEDYLDQRQDFEWNGEAHVGNDAAHLLYHLRAKRKAENV